MLGELLRFESAMKQYIEQLKTCGFAIVRNVVAAETVAALRQELENIRPAEAVSRHGQSVYGIRNLLNVAPNIRLLANCDALKSLVEPILGKRPLVVRCIFFDKIPKANWKVPWHQDLTIAVREKTEIVGFSCWSLKAGIVHVQPPVSVLQNMLALRVHLDDTDESNGALRVLPGSHKCGRMNAGEIRAWKEKTPAVTCVIPAGGVLAIHPLLLHASSKSSTPSHRRVLHMEYSSSHLLGGLEWYGS